MMGYSDHYNLARVPFTLMVCPLLEVIGCDY